MSGDVELGAGMIGIRFLYIYTRLQVGGMSDGGIRNMTLYILPKVG